MVGVPEPRLIKLLEQLLTVHTSWFKLQHCADPFCSLMGLDVIMLAPEGDSDGAAAAAGPSWRSTQQGPGGQPSRPHLERSRGPRTASAASEDDEEDDSMESDEEMEYRFDVGSGGGGGGGVGRGDGDGGGGRGGSGVPAPFNEASVLTLMEFMALSRADAIQLLAQHGGNVETVLAQLLT